MPDSNQPYHDDPYHHQIQGQPGQGYYQQEAYGGQYAPDHHDGYGHAVEGYSAPAGGYDEKVHVKQERYEYGHHQEGPPGPQGGRWDQQGYR